MVILSKDYVVNGFERAALNLLKYSISLELNIGIQPPALEGLVRLHLNSANALQDKN